MTTPWLHTDLENEEEQNVHPHQTPGTPGTHTANLIRPDLLFVVPGENALAQLRGGLFRLALGHGQDLLCFILGDLVGMIVAVEVGESLEVCGGPGVFSLEEFVDFALGGGAAVYGGCVVIFCFADVTTC